MSGASLIDWAGVARNALWIAGLSLALAAFSYASWQARAQHSGLRKTLDGRAFQAPFSAGLLLFSVSMAWGAAAVWERIAWIILAAAFAWQAVYKGRQGISKE